jgi:hypothetical protein
MWARGLVSAKVAAPAGIQSQATVNRTHRLLDADVSDDRLLELICPTTSRSASYGTRTPNPGPEGGSESGEVLCLPLDAARAGRCGSAATRMSDPRRRSPDDPRPASPQVRVTPQERCRAPPASPHAGTPTARRRPSRRASIPCFSSACSNACANRRRSDPRRHRTPKSQTARTRETISPLSCTRWELNRGFGPRSFASECGTRRSTIRLNEYAGLFDGACHHDEIRRRCVLARTA